jgi:hypothetical protein
MVSMRLLRRPLPLPVPEMKAVFTAAALLATLSAPAAFAGVRNDPHPMKMDAPAQPTTAAPNKTKAPKAAPTTKPAPAPKTN